jgi:hypothetical protein
MFLAEAVITGISIFWIEAVAYGFVRTRRSGQAQTA